MTRKDFEFSKILLKSTKLIANLYMDFDHKKIEEKWAKKWREIGIYKTPKDATRENKSYVLPQLPYPSGSGLHVGHAEGYFACDITARYQRMTGKKVLQVIGWDAFGLPAENYAIKTNVHPRKTTNDAIDNFRTQIKGMGISVDWDREVGSHNPDYYKWTQWFFLLMHERGLAYRKNQKVNWCPSCLTVLANEQVVDGKCERCGTEVEQKEMEQWYLKITDYADRLYDDLDKVDWPEESVKRQRDWIGRSEGINIDYRVADDEPEIKNVYGNPQFDFDKSYEEAKKEKMKFMVLAVIKNQKGDVLVVKRTEEDQKDTWDLIGGSLKQDDVVKGLQVEIKEETGIKADELKFIYSYDGYNPEFKQNYRYFVYEQVVPDDAKIKLSEEHSEYEFVTAEEAQKRLYWEGHKRAVKYSTNVITAFTTTPVNFGATFLVLAPEHPMVTKITTTENKKEVEKYVAKAINKTDLERQKEGKEKTGVFTGSYVINHVTGEKIPVWIADFVLATVGTGAVQGCPAHDERDFDFAKKFGLPIIRVVESPKGEKERIVDPEKEKVDQTKINHGIKRKMVNSAQFNGLPFDEAMKKTMDYFEQKGWGNRIVNYKLRDWSVSRQRFWGAPVPMVYDPEGNTHPVKPDDLPVMLPDDVDFIPTGRSPLTYSENFQKGVEEKYGKGWKREVDTLDTFMCSSWYYFRYLDPKNDKAFASSEALKAWMPVDFYIGGPEHVNGHLLYSRFFTKVLFDAGYIDFDEPFLFHRHQGTILGPDNRRMSKRWGNVINPNDVVDRHGADTLRLYEMFMGPLEDTKPWDTKGEAGVYRFLKKVWNLQNKVNEKYKSEEQERWINKLIKKVGNDIEALSFNTSIAKFMEFSNFLLKEEKINRSVWERFLLVMAPFAVFITEELWEKLGNKDSIHKEAWPKHDEKLAQDETIKIAVQINGKARAEIEITPGESEDSVRSKVEMSEKAQDYIKGSKIKKFIYVPGRIVNIVI